jgi:hypothetical protein
MLTLSISGHDPKQASAARRLYERVDATRKQGIVPLLRVEELAVCAKVVAGRTAWPKIGGFSAQLCRNAVARLTRGPMD